MSGGMTFTTGKSSPLIALTLIVFLAFATDLSAATWKFNRDKAQIIEPETTSSLQDFFQTLDYNWTRLENGAPPFILEKIPEDINNTGSIETKKRAFFMGLLPMILIANQEIKNEREEIKRILARHESRVTQNGDKERLTRIAARYGLRGNAFTDQWIRKRLLRRVDTIPPSLVLAQAANESAWGTSRFAQRGNNLFGEWTFRSGSGIVPAERSEGEFHELRKFPSLYESIRSYMNNLNSHGAYHELRQIRESLRREGKPVTGMALANGLQQYSERGEDYIREIKAMIRHNQLARVNMAFLRTPETDEQDKVNRLGSGLFSTRDRLTGLQMAGWTNP